MTETAALPERDTEHERVISILFSLPPLPSSVVSCLSRAPMCTSAELSAFTGAKSKIKIAISKARTKLREHNLTINSRLGAGYWMDAPDRKALDDMVQSFLSGGA
jgi:hypothetical protein